MSAGTCEWEAFSADFASDTGSCGEPAAQVYQIDQFKPYELCIEHVVRALREYADLINEGIDSAPIQVYPL